MTETLNRPEHPEHFSEVHHENGEALMCMSSDGECRVLVEVMAGYSPEEEQQFIASTTSALEAIDRFTGGRAADIFTGLHIKIGEDVAGGGAKAVAEENQVLLNGRKMLLSVAEMKQVSGAYSDEELAGFPDEHRPGGALEYTLVHEIGHVLDGQTKTGEAYHRVAASESPTKYGREADEWHNDNKDHEAFAEGFAHAVYGMPITETMETTVRKTIDARAQEIAEALPNIPETTELGQAEVQDAATKMPPLDILDKAGSRMASSHISRYVSDLARRGAGYIDRNKIGSESHGYQAQELLSQEDVRIGVEWALSDRLQEEVRAETADLPAIEATDSHRAAILHELSEAMRSTYLRGHHTSFSRVRSAPHSPYEKMDGYIERQAIPLTAKEVESIVTSSEDDKLSALAEILDPYRWRADSQASEDEKLHAKQELLQAIQILESLAPGLQKDLMTIAARELCLKRGSVESADKLLGGIDSRIARVLAWEAGRDYDPTRVVESIRESSKVYGDKIIETIKGRISGDIEPASNHSIILNLSPVALGTFLFDTHRVLTTHDGMTTGMGGGDSRKHSEASAGWIEATDVVNARPIYGTLVTDEEKLIGAANYGSVVLVMKPEVISRTTFTYGDSLNEHSYARPEEQLVFEDAKRVKDAEMTAKKQGVPTGGMDSPSRTLAYRDTRYVEAQILGGLEIDDIDEIILDLPEPGVLSRIRESYPDTPLTVRVRKEHAERLMAEHPDIFDQNANRLGSNVKFVVIEDTTELGNDGRKTVNKVRILAAN